MVCSNLGSECKLLTPSPAWLQVSTPKLIFFVYVSVCVHTCVPADTESLHVDQSVCRAWPCKPLGRHVKVGGAACHLSPVCVSQVDEGQPVSF